MIRLTDVLTNRRWDLPDTLAVGIWPSLPSQAALNIGTFPPGRYDIRNGSGGPLLVFVGSGIVATIPDGATWNISNNENDRAKFAFCPDWAVWMHSGRFN